MYDEFTETSPSSSSSSFPSTQLETRLSHLQPVEILYPKTASRGLENTLMEWKRFRYIGSIACKDDLVSTVGYRNSEAVVQSHSLGSSKQV